MLDCIGLGMAQRAALSVFNPPAMPPHKEYWLGYEQLQPRACRRRSLNYKVIPVCITCSGLLLLCA